MSHSKQTLHKKNKRKFINPHKINSHLYCPICLDVFQQPSRLLCGHTFCYICIQQWANSIKKNICPECKCDFLKRKPEKDLIASKLVDQLIVKCIHQECKWEGQNSLSKKHQRVCQYRQKKNILTDPDELVVLDEELQDVIQINQSQAKKQLVKNVKAIICYTLIPPPRNNQFQE